MIRRFAGILFLLLVLLGGIALAQAGSDIEEDPSCAVCGMDRKAYGYSRMLIIYEDGARTAVCSLHCAVEELEAHRSRPLKELLVADRDSRELINVEKATWVMGGKKRGVMTRYPKWAFATEGAANSFTEAYGGKLAHWPEPMAAAIEETSKMH